MPGQLVFDLGKYEFGTAQKRGIGPWNVDRVGWEMFHQCFLLNLMHFHDERQGVRSLPSIEHGCVVSDTRLRASWLSLSSLCFAPNTPPINLLPVKARCFLLIVLLYDQPRSVNEATT